MVELSRTSIKNFAFGWGLSLTAFAKECGVSYCRLKNFLEGGNIGILPFHRIISYVTKRIKEEKKQATKSTLDNGCVFYFA